MLNRIFSIIIILAMVSMPATAREYTVRLKWFHQFQFAGLYAAQKKGFYKNHGITVKILERDVAKSPAEEVVKGEVDFGVADSSLIQYKLNGSPVVVLAAIFQNSPLVLISLADQNILSPVDLKGKKVMYQSGIDDAMIQALFNESGLDRDDFTHIQHNFDDQALLSGYTDTMTAYITDQPFMYQQKNISINILNPANYGIDFYGDMLFTSEKMMLDDPKAVLAFRAATIEGWRYALENPNEVIQWIMTDFNTHNKSREALRYEAALTKRMIKPKLIEIGNVNLGRFRRIADIYKEMGHAPQNGNIDNLYYKELLDKTSDRLGIVVIVFGVFVVILLVLTSIITGVNRRLKRLVKVRTAELESANADLVEEQYAAKSFYEKIIRFGCLEEFKIKAHVSNFGIFGGDMVMSAKDAKNDNVIHLLIADMTGHGLGAAIGLIPLAMAFYDAIEDKIEKEKTIEKLNEVIRTYCPLGKFCAACYIVIDYENCVYHYWNASIPWPLHYQYEQHTMRELIPKHPVLGAMKKSELVTDFDTHTFAPKDKIFIYTDGILETSNQHGDMYGRSRLAELLLNVVNNDNTLKVLMKALEEFGGMNYQDDDITFVSVPLFKKK